MEPVCLANFGGLNCFQELGLGSCEGIDPFLGKMPLDYRRDFQANWGCTPDRIDMHDLTNLYTFYIGPYERFALEAPPD